MGYTHYWEMQDIKAIPAEAIAILREILTEAYQDGIIQYEHDVKDAPYPFRGQGAAEAPAAQAGGR